MTESILFSLLRTAIGTEPAGRSKTADLTEEALTAVYSLAKRHDMAHLIGQALDKNGLDGNLTISQMLNKQTMQAVYRCARQQDEFERVAQLLEDAKVPYIPLKGTVIRDWYPEPWMRTSTDIDILIRKEDLDGSVRMLVEKLGYRHEGTAFHDASLFSPSGVHLELHYKLVDDTAPEKVRQHLLDIWNHASAADGYSYRFDMDEDWFYLYHIFHMSKHLLNGGCGIKPFLDLWIMNRGKGFRAQCYESLLNECGLLTAARAFESLAEIWFSGATWDDLSYRLASFVLDGGVHGTLDGNTAVLQVRKGGKYQSIWQKIFLPYDIMKEYYPILCKHKWLLPGAEVLRWINRLFDGGVSRFVRVFRKIITISDEETETTRRLLKDLDLS